MLSQLEVELIDAPFVISTLLGVPRASRYQNLATYYFWRPATENHNYHLACLLKLLKQSRYRDQLVKQERQDLYALLITKDLLLRNQTDNAVLKGYIRYYATFEFSREDLKRILQGYAA